MVINEIEYQQFEFSFNNLYKKKFILIFIGSDRLNNPLCALTSMIHAVYDNNKIKARTAVLVLDYFYKYYEDTKIHIDVNEDFLYASWSCVETALKELSYDAVVEGSYLFISVLDKCGCFNNNNFRESVIYNIRSSISKFKKGE